MLPHVAGDGTRTFAEELAPDAVERVPQKDYEWLSQSKLMDLPTAVRYLGV